MHPVTVFAIHGHLTGYYAEASDVPSAGRPPFFILEKRRRPPSSLKAVGNQNLVHPSNIKLSSHNTITSTRLQGGRRRRFFSGEKTAIGDESLHLVDSQNAMDGGGILKPRMNEEVSEPRFRLGGFQRVSHYTLWSWVRHGSPKIGLARTANKADGVGAGIAPIDPH